jgi:hypothetical protein
MTWWLVSIALVGTVLNVRQDRRGFLFWGVSDLGLAVVNAMVGQWAQATLFFIYLGLAIWGWLSWTGCVKR